MSENVRASTSRKPKGLHGLYRDNFNFTFIFLGNLEGKTPLGRPGRRWVANIKMEFREIHVGWSGMDWIDLAQDRDQWMALVTTALNRRVP
jgi:hypothetical protein